MKKLIKTLAVLTALAALSFGVTSCSSDSSDNNTLIPNNPQTGTTTTTTTPTTTTTTTTTPTTTTTTTPTTTTTTASNTATFTANAYGGIVKIDYSADGTYLMTWSMSGYSTNKGKGTYTLTGTFDNGTIHQHQTHSSDTLNTGWTPEEENYDLVVTNGTFSVKIEGSTPTVFTKTTSSTSGTTTTTPTTTTPTTTTTTTTPSTSDTKTALAIYTCNTGSDIRTLTFYADSTFKAIVSDSSTPHAEGTYKLTSGNWESGNISMTASSGSKASTFSGSRSISGKSIIFSSKTYTLTGGTKTLPTATTTSTASDVYYESSFGESAVAVFRYKYEDSSGYETIYFYSDGTWKCREYTYGYRSTDYTGKWSRTSGNWTNGVISFTAETHNKRTANFGTIPLTITNGKFKMRIWDTPSIVESKDSSPEYIKR